MSDEDPWDLLGKEVSSKHYKGLKATVVAYDHTGFEQAKCECGEIYVHDEGAYNERPLSTEEINNIMKKVYCSTE